MTAGNSLGLDSSSDRSFSITCLMKSVGRTRTRRLTWFSSLTLCPYLASPFVMGLIPGALCLAGFT
jgi:hypothetical protein